MSLNQRGDNKRYKDCILTASGKYHTSDYFGAKSNNKQK